MRLIFLIFLLANVAAFGYILHTGSRSGADMQFELLQIAPEKLKLVQPATARGARPLPVCLEWSGFSAEETTRAAAALAGLGLGDRLSLRDAGESYWVYIPPGRTQADAEKKAGELRALGISDFSIILDGGQWQYALALGEFSNAEAAASFLAQIKQKGVRTAQSAPRGSRQTAFVVRDPGDAVAAKMAELRADFPATQIKAAICSDAAVARK
jgi:SPOR domain